MSTPMVTPYGENKAGGPDQYIVDNEFIKSNYKKIEIQNIEIVLYKKLVSSYQEDVEDTTNRVSELSECISNS